jgi:hypothetical protein
MRSMLCREEVEGKSKKEKGKTAEVREMGTGE